MCPCDIKQLTPGPLITLGNDYHRQCPLLSAENLRGSLEVYFGALPSALSFLVVFINALAKDTDSMWTRFVEAGNLGGTANVLDEGVGTKQTSGQF